MTASLLTIVPVVANVPWMPPFGLLMLLAWRLRDAEVFPSWGPLGLGLFDDLLSGQPLGSAMALWTITFIVIDIIDNRLVWRDFPHDWVVAGGAVAFCLVAARLVASPLRAHVDTVVLIQIIVSVALYPLAALVCARLDARRRRYQR
ncbi:rod shape-determining protein MreD [Sphingomonas donggukensis]|uniref:Rod shape-determining protein MreD n=1 Tax=Sphingomonas donggukensis TaxID=2949093 RepID=A0ABY4TVJ2_9SPHN|nr:rod shape-determining protein MreD [Sphingomonas donggukensis]URW76425.1 rod shape-determining protein MreD [Sphingomonas donggukensis]